jgi:hypothetical protein
MNLLTIKRLEALYFNAAGKQQLSLASILSVNGKR